MEVNKLKGEITKITQENNLLKAKIIDIEQIISKYEQKNIEYNNYINSCYIFFNNITQLGYNQLEFDTNQCNNNKLMNLNEFKNNFKKIENYILFLQKELQKITNNNYLYNNITNEPLMIKNEFNNENMNDNLNNQNNDKSEENFNNMSDYNSDENMFTKKLNCNNPNCSNIANCDEDNYYENYNNEMCGEYNNGNNEEEYNHPNDNNNIFNNNKNNLMVEDLNNNNYITNRRQNQNIKNLNNNNIPYEIYKTLEERVNMLEKEMNLQKQSNLLQSNNKKSKNNKKKNVNVNSNNLFMNNNFYNENSKDNKKVAGTGKLKKSKRPKSNIRNININNIVNTQNPPKSPIPSQGTNKNKVMRKKKKKNSHKTNNLSQMPPQTLQNNFYNLNNQNNIINNNTNFNEIQKNVKNKGINKITKKHSKKLKRSVTPKITEDKGQY